VVAALGVAGLVAGFMVVGTAGTAQAEADNVWVCKYVGQPEVGEEAHHVIPQSAVGLGEWFTDGQTSSIAVKAVTSASDKLEEAAAFALCPGYLEVTATNPTVVQSSQCEVEGTYTIPTTPGVQYLLDGEGIAAGTYTGPETGVATAVALDGLVLSNPTFSFALNVTAAADCAPPPLPVDLCSNLDGNQAAVPEGYTRDAQTNICTQVPVPTEATAVAPEVVQSEACEVEGSYTIPVTAGVLYLLDGEPLTAGTHDGPVSGLVTAVEVEGYVLANPDFEFELLVEPAEACPPEVLPTEAVDLCSNLPGDQAAVPAGYELEKGTCVKVERPEPKPPVEQPDEVLGTQAAVPTQVDAGLVGPTSTTGGPGNALGQTLMAAGLLLLVLAGAMQAGRRERGVHEL
jgi:hypothetical protein